MKIEYPKRHNLANLPTPIIPLTNLSKQFDKTTIWLKRDDFTGVELSGNKIRKLEYLLREATEQGAKRILTCGGIQSNHCRAATYAALKLGLNVTLFLRGNDESPAQANHFLNKIATVDIVYLTKEEYDNVDTLMAEAAIEYDDKCYIIPEGGSNATGAWGYIRCYREILKQQEELNLVFDLIIVATGSGGTHAGLLLGNKIYSGPEVCSVIVCDDEQFFINKINKVCSTFSKKYNLTLNINDNDINLIGGFIGEGYGMIYDDVKNTIRMLIKKEGIILEPVYTAKAFNGFLNKLEKKKIKGNNILFIHTGGIFGLFPYSNQM